VFRVFFIALVGAVFFYITHQVLEGTDLPLFADVLIVGFLVIIVGMILALPAYFWMASRRDHKSWFDRFFFYTYLSLAYINFLIFFLIFRDIAALALRVFQADYDPARLYNPTAMGLLLVLPMMFIFLGTLVVRVGAKHKKVVLHFPDLPLALENFRLLHITDLHIGNNLSRAFVENLLETADKIPVDAVVFTGDILDGELHRNVSEVELLKKLRSRHGTFYVPGNHEYYWRAEQTIKAFSDIGFRVLINESHSLRIGDALLQISGVPDPEAKVFNFETPDFEKLKRSFQPDTFKILLSHQPWLADHASPAGFHLQLSGHTHGGQFFPWNYLVGLFQKYSKGVYHIGSMQLYVNQGAGFWGPSVRLGTYCELAEIILTRGPR
jgi:hypothetical protein